MTNQAAADSLFWECHVCAERFSPTGGGVCSRCHRATCLLHIRMIGPQTRAAARHRAAMCTTCLGPAASTSPFPGGFTLPKAFTPPEGFTLRGLWSFLVRAAADAWRRRDRFRTPRA